VGLLPRVLPRPNAGAPAAVTGPDPAESESDPGIEPARADRWPAGLVAAVAVAGFALARLLDLVVLQHAAGRHPGHSLGGYLTVWDGGWYRDIAAHGYPPDIHQAPSGWFYKSALAFFPAYPGLVRGVQDVTQLPFTAAGVLVSLAAGAAAAALVALVLRPALGSAAAATAAVFWSFLPVSPLLMMTYTEALFSLELAAFFWLLARRRYLWLAVLLPVTGLTRGALPPLAVVLLVHLAVRLREPPGEEAGRRRLRAVGPVAGLLVVLVASFALWPAWVAQRTGRLDAYLRIQQSWIRDRGTWQSWGRSLDLLWHGQAGPAGRALATADGLVAAVGLALLALALVALLLPLSPEVKVLAPSWLLFLVLAEPAWSSFYRYALPLFTLLAVPAMVVRARWWPVRVVGLAAILAGLAAGQWWWLEHFVIPFPGGLTP
jgi:hypothetical protein